MRKKNEKNMRVENAGEKKIREKVSTELKYRGKTRILLIRNQI